MQPKFLNLEKFVWMRAQLCGYAHTRVEVSSLSWVSFLVVLQLSLFETQSLTNPENTGLARLGGHQDPVSSFLVLGLQMCVLHPAFCVLFTLAKIYDPICFPKV